MPGRRRGLRHSHAGHLHVLRIHIRHVHLLFGLRLHWLRLIVQTKLTRVRRNALRSGERYTQNDCKEA
jgi:hypothetical protein